MVDATKALLLPTEPDTVTAAPLLPTESVTTAAFHPSNHSTPLRRFPSEVADYLSPLQKRQTEISHDSTFFEELDMSVVEADKVCCHAPVPEKKETVTAAPLLPTEPVTVTAAPLLPTEPVTVTAAPLLPTEPVTVTAAPLLPTEPVTVTAAPLLPTEPVTVTAAPLLLKEPVTVTAAPLLPTEPVTVTAAPLLPTEPVTITSAPLLPTESVTITAAPLLPTEPDTVTAAPLLPTEQDVTKKQAPAPVVDPKPNCWYLFEFEGRTKKKIVYVGEVKTAIGIEITVQFYRIAAPLMDKLTFKKDRGGVEIVYADQVIAKVNPPEFLNKGLIKFEASTFSAVNSKNIA